MRKLSIDALNGDKQRLVPVKHHPDAEISVVLIHGTFGRNSKWTHSDSQLVSHISAENPEIDIFRFVWSGYPRQASRFAAAQLLAIEIMNLLARYRHVCIVGHSHGGNVALQAIQQSHAINVSLITLATPFLHLYGAGAARSFRNSIALFVAISYFIGVAIVTTYYWMSVQIWVFSLAALTSIFLASVITYERWLLPIANYLSSFADERKAIYQNLSISKPISILIIRLGDAGTSIIDEFSRIFSVLRLTVRRIGKASKNLERASINSLDNFVVPNSFLLLFACVLVLIAIVLFYFQQSTTLGVGLLIAAALAVTTTTPFMTSLVIKELFWALYAVTKTGHPFDAFFIAFKVSERPQLGNDKPIEISELSVLPHKRIPMACRPFPWNWHHTSLYANPVVIVKISNWITERHRIL